MGQGWPSGVLGLEPPGRGCDMGRDQLLLVPGVVLVGRSYELICSWLLLILGLEVLRKAEPDVACAHLGILCEH